MKNIVKKIVAASFCGALLLSTTACSDTSWSVKNDNETLSIGTYIYYMSQAYSEAKEKSGKSGDAVLSETIEKKTGDQWIRDRAKELCLEQLTVNKLCKDNKVTVTDDEIDTSYNDSSQFYGMYSYAQMWIYSKQSYEDMGISEDSYKNAVVGTAVAKDKLFDNIYGEGGSQEVKESELEKYFTDNYVYYKYFSASLTKTDDDGNSTDLTDAEKETLKVKYENYAKMINNEKKTIDDVIEKYKENEDTEDDPSMVSCDNINDSFVIGDEVKDKLEKMKDGEAAYVATDSEYYFVYKMPIKDNISSLTDKNDTSLHSQVIHKYKNDDFTKYIDEQTKKLKYEQNDAAFAKYTPDRVIPDEDNSTAEESSTVSSEESIEESSESSKESASSEQTSSTGTDTESEVSASSGTESSDSGSSSKASESSDEVTSKTVEQSKAETSVASAVENKPESSASGTASSAADQTSSAASNNFAA